MRISGKTLSKPSVFIEIAGGRCDYGTAMSQKSFYVYGGKNVMFSNRQIDMFDFWEFKDLEEWNQINSNTPKLINTMLAEFNNNVFLFGQNSNSKSNENHELYELHMYQKSSTFLIINF